MFAAHAQLKKSVNLVPSFSQRERETLGTTLEDGVNLTDIHTHLKKTIMKN